MRVPKTSAQKYEINQWTIAGEVNKRSQIEHTATTINTG